MLGDIGATWDLYRLRFKVAIRPVLLLRVPSASDSIREQLQYSRWLHPVKNLGPQVSHDV